MTALRRTISLMDKLPGPRRRMWPFGNADMIPKNGVEFLELMVDLSKTYGEVSTFWLGPRPLVFVTSPTITKELISKDPDSFEKGDAYNNLKPWLGSSILLSEGEHWRHKRTALGRAFRLAHLKAFAPIFSYSTARLVALLDGRLDGAAAAAGSGRSGLEVDPLDLMTRVTQDIIGLSAFGFDFHAVPSWPLRDPRCNHYHTLTQLMDSRDRSMLLNLMPNALYLLTPPGRVFKQSVEGLALEARQIIERRLSGEQPERPDLLSFMIEPDPDTEQQVMLSAQELVEEVNLFIFAGHETTSSTLTWALYFLAQHPDIMRRVRDEIDAIGGVEALSDYDSSSKLKTLTNVVKETLRLATPTIAFVRQPTVELEAQGYRFPAGVPIVFASHSCHMNPNYWPDPHRFDPDRFTPENSKGRHPFAWTPFAVGARNCIGQPFALLESRVVLAMLVHAYDWEVVSPPVKQLFLLLRPVDAKMRITRRLK